MRVWICGVRGSTPAPGCEFAAVGGHTSCVAVGHDGEPPRLVLDAGTGLRRLTEVLAGAPFQGTLLLGHLHWDHTTGLPFFAAGDREDARVDVLMPEQGMDAEELLSRAMSPPHFPITPAELRGRWSFASIDEGEYELEGFAVVAIEIPHKGGRTFGYRVSDPRGGSLAYLSDHGPLACGDGAHGLGPLHPAAKELAHGVDALIHDAQYTPEELACRRSYGHSAADYGAHLAEATDARRVLLFHHDPARTDQQVAELAAGVRERNPYVEVDVAVEGMVIDL
jgi:phosphoribosyl 1,2-cyclic phosphodiesterase